MSSTLNDSKIIIQYSSIKCSICLEIMNDPYECTNAHHYCKKCIYKWYRNNINCPVCKINGYSQPSKTMKKIINDINIQCSQCSEYIPYGKKTFHLYNECSERYVICKNSSVCKWAGQYKNLRMHLIRQCIGEPVIDKKP